MKRTALAAIALAATLTTLSTVAAQDREVRDEIRIEIRDGRILVNGEEVGEAVGDRIVFRKEDGERITIRLDDGEGMVWVGDDDGDHSVRFGRNGAFLFGDGVAGTVDRHRDNVLSFGGANSFFRDSDPAGLLHERLLNLNGMDDTFEVLRDGHFPRALRLDSEAMRLEREINELARRVRRAEGNERAELEAELDQMLAQAFEARLDNEREQAAELEERLATLRERLAERNASRQEIIARKKSRLLGERDILDW